MMTWTSMAGGQRPTAYDHLENALKLLANAKSFLETGNKIDGDPLDYIEQACDCVRQAQSQLSESRFDWRRPESKRRR
jgi:hypothetical protein